MESGREDADDALETRTAARQVLPDDAGITAKAAVPVLVAQDRDRRQLWRLRWRAGHLRDRRRRDPVGIVEVAAKQDGRAHHAEEIRRHAPDADLLRCPIGARHDLPAGVDRRHVLERVLRAVAQIGIVFRGDRHAQVIACSEIGVQDDELLGILVGQRTQQHGVGHAEDRRARANAQPDGERGGQREDRAPPEGARRERQVPQHTVGAPSLSLPSGSGDRAT